MTYLDELQWTTTVFAWTFASVLLCIAVVVLFCSKGKP